MFRVAIDWDYMSPLLRVASGIVHVHHVQDGYITEHTQIAKFKVKCKPGSRRYTTIDGKGISSKIFDPIKPQLDIMVTSFISGMNLEKTPAMWLIEKNIDESYKKLKDLYRNFDE